MGNFDGEEKCGQGVIAEFIAPNQVSIAALGEGFEIRIEPSGLTGVKIDVTDTQKTPNMQYGGYYLPFPCSGAAFIDAPEVRGHRAEFGLAVSNGLAGFVMGLKKTGVECEYVLNGRSYAVSRGGLSRLVKRKALPVTKTTFIEGESIAVVFNDEFLTLLAMNTGEGSTFLRSVLLDVLPQNSDCTRSVSAIEGCLSYVRANSHKVKGNQFHDYWVIDEYMGNSGFLITEVLGLFGRVYGYESRSVVLGFMRGISKKLQELDRERLFQGQKFGLAAVYLGKPKTNRRYRNSNEKTGVDEE